MSFYELIHCTGKVHCKTCRSRHGGVKFRKDWGIGDADCPEGIPWDERTIKGTTIFVSEQGCKEVITIDQQFDAIQKEAESMQGEMWDTLRIQIKGVETALEQHPNNSACWRNKQKIRIFSMYNKIKGVRGVLVKTEILKNLDQNL